MKANEATEERRTDLEITVCANGIVNVRNPESDRAHSVMLADDGTAIRCSCRGHRFNGGCYHTGNVESRPLIVATARAASGRVACDGGEVRC